MTDTPTDDDTDAAPSPGDLPPSAKFVHDKLVAADSPLSSKKLAERTELPRRTVNDALQRLRNRGVVEQEECMGETAKPCYRARARDGSSDGE